MINLLFVTAFPLIASLADGFYIVFPGLSQRNRWSGLTLTYAGLILSGSMLLRPEIISGATGKIGLREGNRPPLMVAVTAHTIVCLPGIVLLINNLT